MKSKKKDVGKNVSAQVETACNCLSCTYLQHLKQALDTAGLRAILVHEDAPQVKKARVLVHLVQLYHLQKAERVSIQQALKHV